MPCPCLSCHTHRTFAMAGETGILYHATPYTTCCSTHTTHTQTHDTVYKQRVMPHPLPSRPYPDGDAYRHVFWRWQICSSPPRFTYLARSLPHYLFSFAPFGPYSLPTPRPYLHHYTFYHAAQPSPYPVAYMPLHLPSTDALHSFAFPPTRRVCLEVISDGGGTGHSCGNGMIKSIAFTHTAAVRALILSPCMIYHIIIFDGSGVSVISSHPASHTHPSHALPLATCLLITPPHHLQQKPPSLTHLRLPTGGLLLLPFFCTP